tara:strand:+ start:230 stop:493 length:264 start_codon:yes stop_codon:yes gene_type:complete
MSDLALPTLHLNGSGQQNLYDQFSDATEALRNAIETMRRMTPNGRDYYVQGDADCYREAMAQHEARVLKVSGVLEEIEELFYNVDWV